MARSVVASAVAWVVAVVPLGRAGVPERLAAVPVYEPPVTSNFVAFEEEVGVAVKPTAFAVLVAKGARL